MRRKTVHIALWRFSLLLLAAITMNAAFASSHREAPLISNDPLADNTDVYAFRSPDDTSTVTIIANYIPFELPEGGPNYYTFGLNVRYEIHIKNESNNPGDDITYRFTFTSVNEDPTTFFNIRLGKQNLKRMYTCEKSVGGGAFAAIVTNGIVPPNNIGPRSIDSSAVGLDSTYDEIMTNAIATATSGEKIYCGPADDPFFVDLAGAFDVGNFRPEGNATNPTKDGLARYNVHSIALKIPIAMLQKDGKGVTATTGILNPDYVIGVYASASRPMMKTINTDGTRSYSGDWVQVSRLGMPLTNEAVIPIGMKDKWNATPLSGDSAFVPYFSNPELSLYMSETLTDGYFGEAVPSLNALRIQTNAQTVLGNVDFRNGKPGLYVLKGNAALTGTALAPGSEGGLGDILLPNNSSPRSVDILPIFYTGVPNLAPYQLATGKPKGNPLATGKPFINNFLPTLNDMLRLNMSTPVTPRNSADFSPLGIVQAAKLGLTDARFNTDASLQFIPNMDGFPNGRRLEDDVTTIELQAVSGVALAAIGLFYDDYVLADSASASSTPVTQDLLNVLSFTAGPTKNDTTFKTAFPYVQTPWRGYDYTYQQRF